MKSRSVPELRARARRRMSGVLLAVFLTACTATAPLESPTPTAAPTSTSEGADEVGRLEDQLQTLEAENATLEDQVQTLEDEKASLEEQLSHFLNTGPGPNPTALLTVNWVRFVIPEQPSTVVCVTIENTSADNATVFYAESQFSAFDGDGFVYPIVVDPHFLTIPLESGELGPGESRRGQLPFNVPPPSWPLTRLIWQTGIEETPEITVDLPPPSDWTNADQC